MYNTLFGTGGDINCGVEIRSWIDSTYVCIVAEQSASETPCRFLKPIEITNATRHALEHFEYRETPRTTPEDVSTD